MKNNVDTARNGLYVYELPGGLLEFRKQIGNSVQEVSRVSIDLMPTEPASHSSGSGTDSEGRSRAGDQRIT